MSAAAWAFAAAATAAAAPADDCLVRLRDVASPPAFAAFPARPEAGLRPAAIRLDQPRAREFRTQLREAARGGVNFAGHYILATWGCGSACIEMAIIDARSGEVSFDPRLSDVSLARVGPDEGVEGAGNGASAARFRRDSRLVVVLGAPQEDEAREGAAFYDWTGARLRLIRFVPRARACDSRP
jgi:hypothetical protein